jgi:Rps23 Pro-64 3,4-dihydroxylase Tpa1-like proline 4-hydroxylase
MIDIEQVKTDKFNFYLFRNIFNDEELELIWRESLFLCDNDKLLPPDKTGTGKREDGTPKKSNVGIQLDNCYSDRTICNYFKFYKKPLDNLISNTSFIKNDYTLKLYLNTNLDKTLFNYYDDNDYYESHNDLSCYTYVFWLLYEPKRFTGGNLKFDDIDYNIEVKSNMGVLFPSWANHSVERVNLLSNIQHLKGNGRFSFTTFFLMKTRTE